MTHSTGKGMGSEGRPVLNPETERRLKVGTIDSDRVANRPDASHDPAGPLLAEAQLRESFFEKVPVNAVVRL